MCALVCLFLLLLAPAASSAADPVEYEYLKAFGPDGTQSSEFGRAGPVAFDQQADILYAADTAAGKLYKFNEDGNPVDWGGSAPNIQGNEITGLSFFGWAGGTQIAVDQVSHDIYVTTSGSGGELKAFHADGEPAEFTAGTGAGTNSIGGFAELDGVAVDANGRIYASDYYNGVTIFAHSGEPINEISATEPVHIAVDPAGTVYVRRYGEKIHKFTPSGFPVTDSTVYTEAPDPFSDLDARTVAVDPVTAEVYIAPEAIYVYDEAGEAVATFGGPGVGELYLGVGIAIDADSRTVYVGDAGADDAPAQVRVFRRKPPPPPAAPSVEFFSAADAASTSATLVAGINPNSLATTYRFEYGLEDCSAGGCASVPIGGAAIEDGNDLVRVSQALVGLTPHVVYHYRVVAENSLGVTESPDRTFRTQVSGFGISPIDRRAWEMVSPADKHGAIVLGGLGGVSELGGQVQAAADGDGLAYLTRGSIEADPAGSRMIEGATALAQRTEDGWRSKDLSPPSAEAVPLALSLQAEFKLFNTDLSEALLEPRSPGTLSPEASGRGPYWRHNTEPPVYRPLVTAKEGFANVPPGTNFSLEDPDVPGVRSWVSIQAATPDLDHVVLHSGVPLGTGTAEAGEYHWHDGQLERVSVLPDDEGGEMVAGDAGSIPRSSRNAISDDGSRIFWTPFFGSPRLYVRDTVAGETFRIDVAEPDAEGGASKAIFQGASADGGVVLFTDTAHLTSDSSPSGADLYRCELPPSGPAAGCTSLVDLSAPLEGSGEIAEVLGQIPGISNDGDRIYFVARGNLDAGTNPIGDVAVAGKPNLYLWQQGVGRRFIATLSEQDGPNWGSHVEFSHPEEVPASSAKLAAASSPSGRYFAFMSDRKLTEDPNLDASTLEPVVGLFRYDSVSDRLDCVSCDPSGSAPEGRVVPKFGTESDLIDPRERWRQRLVSATLPEPTAALTGAEFSLYRSRAVQDNGRVFFNAIDALVPADANGEWDVYQYEPFGKGTCGASSEDAGTSLPANGCLSLISSGTGDEPAGFLDASVGGDDVFFLTPAKLSVTDRDDLADIYDARVDGIAATLKADVECLGEACQPAAVPPDDATPGTATLRGPGNIHPKHARRCPKGKRKVHRKGHVRCVRKKPRSRPGRSAGAGRAR
jgi:hypothetical protein